MFVAELTHARDPRTWVARVGGKSRISWLMNDALRRNINWSRLTRMFMISSLGSTPDDP
jgi:hypothetical protein